MLKCDKCGSGINAGSRFCPQCGDPVTEADRVTVPQVNGQVANVEIAFGKSASPNYVKAVEICEKLPTYEFTGEGKQVRHTVTLPVTEVDLITNLFDLVGSWKSSQMLIDGHAATKKDLTYGGLGCYQERQKAYKPRQYCFGEKGRSVNIWGCKRLDMPITEYGDDWLGYGTFDNAGAWVFDKARIRHELEKGLKENGACPVLDKRRVLETLEKMPQKVNPKRNPAWEYITRNKIVQGKYQEAAVGIKPVLQEVGAYVLGEYEPEWPQTEPTVIDAQQYTIEVGVSADEPIPKKGFKLSKGWWAVIIIVILILLGQLIP